MTVDMSQVAAKIRVHLREAGFPDEEAANSSVLAVAEEAGEFVGAYRRWSGKARRTGTFDEMSAELADLVITAWMAADALGIDLEAALSDKLAVIFDRGWREAAPES
ncbi:hypothetical protein [Nocardia heshunensis]